MEEVTKLRKRNEIPVEDTWNLADLYPSDEAWEQEAATLETEGLEMGYCDGCGVEQTRTIPVIEPEPETQPTTATPETQPQEDSKPKTTPKKQNHLPLIIACVIVVGCSVALVILLVQESKRKRRRKRKGGKFKR